MNPLPARYCLRNNPGWKAPVGAVCVDGRSEWATPFIVLGSAPNQKLPGYTLGKTVCRTSKIAVFSYREHLAMTIDEARLAHIRTQLAGRPIWCWCKPGRYCHGDILIYLANSQDPLAEVKRKLLDPSEYPPLSPAIPDPVIPPFTPTTYMVRIKDHSTRIRLINWCKKYEAYNADTKEWGGIGSHPQPPGTEFRVEFLGALDPAAGAIQAVDPNPTPPELAHILLCYTRPQ